MFDPQYDENDRSINSNNKLLILSVINEPLIESTTKRKNRLFFSAERT
jgi:hypothetical protein